MVVQCHTKVTYNELNTAHAWGSLILTLVNRPYFTLRHKYTVLDFSGHFLS